MKLNHKARGAFALSSIAAIALSSVAVSAADQPGSKPADMTKPVQVFILMGQSNMVGLGKVTGPDGSLGIRGERKEKVSLTSWTRRATWAERKDVRFARVMSGRGGGMQRFNNEWMTVKTCKTIGPEFGIAEPLGNAVEAPVLILKSCIGNRSLGWDLLPPGSERYEFVIKDKAGAEKKMVYAGYKDKPDSWEIDPTKGLKTEPAPWVDKAGKPIDWYAGKQWDDDISYAKTVLSELDKHYPGADEV